MISFSKSAQIASYLLLLATATHSANAQIISTSPTPVENFSTTPSNLEFVAELEFQPKHQSNKPPAILVDDLFSEQFSFAILPNHIAQAAETTEPDLRVQPRIGAGYISSGGSYPSLGRLEGFVPLWQDVGDELAFLEGRVAINSDNTEAGSLLLGYRGYSESANRVRGGYLALDMRNADSESFYQLGTGYESLGETWDFRFNAYLPLGSRSGVVQDVNLDTGVQTSTRFQGNLLLLETLRQRQRILETESTLGGFDAEAGIRLAHWDNGDLRGFGGIYFYDSPSTPSYLGWRLRLASNFTPNFSAGLALQDDGLFGTRLIASVGATFPGIRSSRPVVDEQLVRTRLGEPTARLPEIALAVQQESEITEDRTSQPLINPEEKQPYRFQHVTLGATGGDGTFENPFGTVQAALGSTIQDGNDVVYVNGDADISIPAFTIPDRVQVLSQGPRQLLAGLPFPNFEQTTARLPFSSVPNFENGIVVELPFSGDGNFPQIQDGVVLGNQTVLAGFQINNASSNAIFGNNIRNIELRNNVIRNPGERGIFLDDVGGSVILFDNFVVGAQGTTPDSGQGILIQNTTSLNAVEATIAGFQANNNRVGIEVSAIGSLESGEVPNQNITIGPSSPANTSIGLGNGASIENSASNNRAEGIRLNASTLGSQEISIQEIAASDNGSDGISVINGTQNGFLAAFQEVQIRDSVIASNAGAGIRIEGNETAEQEFNIDGNQIINNAGAGISSIARNFSIQEFVAKPEINSAGIGTNLISGNGGAGISLETVNADILLVEASQNQFGDNGGVDLQIVSNDSARTCVVAVDNTASLGDSGMLEIVLSNNSSTIFEVSDRNNFSINNNGAMVSFSPNQSSFTNINRSTCLSN